MNIERQQQLETVFRAAMNIQSPAERARFISETCSGEPELQYEVEQLITAESEAGNFIEAKILPSKPIVNRAKMPIY